VYCLYWPLGGEPTHAACWDNRKYCQGFAPGLGETHCKEVRRDYVKKNRAELRKLAEGDRTTWP
jgi:hypothetical protein